MPATKLQHGCYARTTGFSIIQHAYAGALTGYLEALEIADAPDGRHRVVLVRYAGGTGFYQFVEFATVEDVMREVNRLRWGGAIRTDSNRPFERWREATDEEFYSLRDGFIRFVELEPGQVYAEELSQVTVVGENLGTTPTRPGAAPRRGTVELRGQFASGTPLTVHGKVGSYPGPVFLDVVVELTDFPVPRLNPYLDRLSSYVARQGTLTATLSYRVNGDDLEMDLPLWPWQAVLGGPVSVETPDGQVTLKVPPATQSGRRLRLRGRGLPRADGSRGDLYAVARIVVPERLTDAERTAYETLKKAAPAPPDRPAAV